MANTQSLIAELSNEQRQSLMARLQQRSQDDRSQAQTDFYVPKLQPMGEARFEPFPLTDIQQAYWVGRQAAFDLGNIAAHGYMEVDCRGLDLARLETAFNRLIQRHDMLRAVVNPDGRQQILKTVPAYRFEVLDASVAGDESAASLEQVREEMSHQVLDTAVWPLFDIRASLLADGVVRLHLSIDVLIFDALSFDILSEEWRRLYQGDELPPLELSYADYVRGLELMKQTEAYRESCAYWREKIKDLPPGPDFPLAVAPESIARPQFRRLSASLDAARWGQIKSRAQRLGVTPSAVLLAAYGAVVARWSSRKRFTLNLTLFNRLPFHPQVNALVGDFTSVVLLELDYSRPASFSERVKSVQAQLWRDMDHRYVSGVQVLRELTEQRRDANASLFPVVFTSAIKPNPADDTPAAMSWLGDVHYTITQTPQVWLDHQVTEDAGKLEYDWDSVSGLFPDGFLEAMFDAYRQLVGGLAQDDMLWQRPELDLLPREQRQLIAAANATAAPVPAGLLHEPFVRQARANSERIAVIDAEAEFSYGELYRLANRLAQRLWQSGAGSGELVGILLPKGRWQVVAALGILEAGGAYLPIEPGYGPDRIAQIIELSGLQRVVAVDAAAGLRLPAGIEVLTVAELAASAQPVKALPVMRQPTDLAYVIYTSGSTGTPKGVMIDHRGALNTCVDINQRFEVGPDDRVLGLSALNFDLSVYDIFGVLGAGGALVLPDADRQRDPGHWDEMVQRHGVTLWNTVPALMDIYTTYLDEVARRPNTSLRLVMMSGDWIPLPLPEAIRRSCPNAQQFSLGGATEASIWSIIYPIGELSPDWRSIPYGKAMLNQSFHVLDEQMQACPVWVPGELYIGGIGVALGYWRDAERSAAQFVTHPRSGEKMYRTGDLGRLLPCGNIEFLGRKDFQVKINGFRVELGEVEINMARFAGVKAAVCAVTGDSGRARQLIAYYVRDPEAPAAAKTEDNDKIRFRLSQPGLRRFDAAAEAVALAAEPEASDAGYRRRSQRLFPDTAVDLGSLGRLLSRLRRDPAAATPKYRYGSAGSLYPVQLYLYAVPGRIAGLAGGMYYYDPDQHRLVHLPGNGRIDAAYYGSWNAAMVDSAAFHLFLVANLEAIEPLYGQDSMHLCRIESGLITQILEQDAHRFGLATCQLGGFDFERARPLFQLEQRSAYLHALVGGVELGDAELRELQLAQARFQHSDAGFETRLRDYLNQKLPDYMVPSLFIRLDELPLSANGKLDRKALPQPRKEVEAVAAVAVADSDLARQICGVWREVLGVDSVGPGDNFFDLGGTSVDMIKIHTRLRPLLSKDVPLLDMFFVYPTIAALVDYLQPKPRAAAPSAAAADGARRQRSGRAPRRRSGAE
ncbi:amino acid adenylation domain-containing protein [Methylomonas sp. EFPC3]|uniref:amino acid adenylation domain-containing protein n=1 Tax=Methylomonas sp. EFPC3 TaxID=3021710 RepID=UPI002417E755|nr:amino acid adenylation domain-containing protein [Methylomonas sp. EFPC3]WFP51890.1 amino acid adenylation domain-containing protein [Methylomonas sp. EFPC3]